jgi:hypothetical protein
MIARLRDSNVMPLALALQGLLLSIATLFLASGLSPLHGSSSRGGSGAARTQDEASLPRTGELPRDLSPQRLPVPRLPEREELNRPPQPAPKPEGFDGVPAPEGRKLASLRVTDIALAGLISRSMTVPIPEAPDRLDGHSLTGASQGWLTGSARGRGARPGRNPVAVVGATRGIGGSGGGGGYCPTPTGAVGRPVGGRGRGGTTSGGSGGTTSAGSGSSGGTKGTPTSRPSGSKSGGSGGSRGKDGKGT